MRARGSGDPLLGSAGMAESGEARSEDQRARAEGLGERGWS